MTLSSPLLAEGEVTPEMRANAEKAIKSCEEGELKGEVQHLIC
jgi:hypothetical protein